MFEVCSEAIKQHALEEFPKESCGIITGDGYVSLKNIFHNPTEGFLIDPYKLSDYDNILAYVHSHPQEGNVSEIKFGFYPDCPSKADMQQQRLSGKTWGIVVTNGTTCFDPFYFGDGREYKDPLIDRKFRHGVHDCYSSVRAWYWQKRGILLNDYPRSDHWWANGENMYLDSYEKEGFRVIRQSEVVEGCVLLFQIQSKVPNHAGVYLNVGKLFHHPAPSAAAKSRGSYSLSRVEPLLRWQTFLTCCLKRD